MFKCKFKSNLAHVMKNVNKCSQRVEKYSRAEWRACDLFVSPRYQSWHKNNNAHTNISFFLASAYFLSFPIVQETFLTFIQA